MAIQKLNKTFVKGAVLKADELNDMVSKTNEIIDSIDDKIGATYFDAANLRQLQFKSAEDRDAWLNGGGDGLILRSDQFSFSGTISQVKITDEYGSKQLYFTNIQPEAKVTVGFISQTKSITDTSWTEVYEDFVVSVGVDKGATGNYTTIINNQTVMNGNTLTFDIKKYIAAGNNRVRITAIGKETGEVATSVYSATLTSMYLTPSNFAWHVPFVEGNVYQLGGMNIGGSISKKVMVRVTNTEKNFTATYEKNIGTATYTTNAYFFTGMEFPRTGTGTYQVEIWLDANGLESDHLVYNIMCIASADINTAQAVCINDIQKAVNGVDSALFRYAVYNKNTSTASPTIRIEKGGQVWKEETLVDVATGSAQTYSASLEFDDENPTFYIDARVTLGSATQEEQISVDNSASFPAVAGATWYLNAATRNNAQVDKEKIVNEMNGNTHNVTWTNMAWVDGTDGWTTDDSGRKCLLVPARSKGVVSYNPLSDFKQAGKTIEIAYKVSNAADYNENIITIATNPTASNFKGIIIKPKKIIVHSNNLYMEDEKQSYPTKEDELMHVAITIIRDYQGNRDYNICIIYVNGIKKCSFEFTSSDTFLGSNLIVGSETADLSIYKMRVYDSSFGWQDVVQNYINCLPSQSDKIAAFNKINSVIDDSYNIDYDAVYGKYNTMVIEMKDGAPLPDLLHQSGGNCDMWIKILNPLEGELDSDFASFFNGSKIVNQPIEGQGTTAMTYYRWNFRWKMTSDYNKRRITAKKNVASSMQDHKMGATRMYNDLNRAIVGANEANARVAVFQYPVYGFERKLVEGTTDEYIYEFIGVYTIGPDKGDKPTFGYNNNTYKDTCIHMEGTDHTPKVVGMDYPWEATRFSGVKDVESIGAIISSTTISKAWEVGMAGDYATDDVADEANVQALLDREFKPAYNVAYYNSTLIEGVTQSLATINSDISAWRAKKNAEGMTYENLEFWTDGVYDLYYYNQQEKVYKATGINLLTDLGISTSTISGMTLSQKNEYFKTKRRERFKANMGKYWHLDDCIFHYTFCMMFAATDNFKKNTYPYKFASLANGGKWRWRQDDLDTLFDINNQGFSAKSFSVLVGDQTSTGSGSVYRGDDSAFWILIRECYKNEIRDMVHRIMNKMDELSPYGSNNLERIVGYVKHCCWDMAQEYFTASAYNEDAEWTYERAWFLKKEGQYNHDVHPLQQSLGSHYEAERDWVELRIVFLASYFQYGAFAADHGNDNSTGTIKWRGIGTKTYNITPALDINPTILIGQNLSISAQKRVLAGETFPLVAEMGSSDTDIYIQGADYYSDLGDLDDLQISADSATLNVSAKRLRRLKVGDATASNVTSNIKGLLVGDCPSMESVDARNLVSLVGDVSLEGCKRLREALFGGTSISQLGIAAGSKIEKLSLPNTLATLSLVKLMNLKEENVDFGTMENISFIRVEKNAHMDGFEMLKAAYNNSDALRNIRIVGFDYEGGSDDLIMISNFATATDENGERKYFGIDDEGRVTSDLPVLDGSLKMAGNAYESDFTTVKLYYPHLNISVNEFYIDFVDKVVQQICATTWGDGVGLTPSKAATITSLGSVFRSNTEIEYFEELEYFTKMTTLYGNAFNKCTNLKSLRLPPSTLVVDGNFCSECPNLVNINLPQSIVKISDAAFRFSPNLSCVVDLPNLIELGRTAFRETGITKIVNLGNVSSLSGDYIFAGCTKLTEAYIPEHIKILGSQLFEGCKNLTIEIPPHITSIGGSAFSHVTISNDIDLPNLESLGAASFSSAKLSKVISLGKITTIGANTFAQSTLEEVNLPNTITTIGDGAFHTTQLTKVDLPASLETMNGGYHFYNSPLQYVICRATTPPTINSSSFNYPSTIFYVPDESVSAYQAATNWSKHASRIKPLSELPASE